MENIRKTNKYERKKKRKNNNDNDIMDDRYHPIEEIIDFS
jgi:hypothetical protein